MNTFSAHFYLLAGVSISLKFFCKLVFILLVFFVSEKMLMKTMMIVMHQRNYPISAFNCMGSDPTIIHNYKVWRAQL